jgi:HupE / UreJ protein
MRLRLHGQSLLSRWLALAGLLLASLLLGGQARAHKASDSYLAIEVQGAQVSGSWDIALRDLDFAIGLDSDGDGNITWGEVRARHGDIAAYAASRLALQADGAACALAIGEQLVTEHTDGAYSVLPLRFACPAGLAPARISVNYTLFADTDPRHRGLLNLTTAGGVFTAILGPQQAQQSFELAQVSGLAAGLKALRDYLLEGVWHIWIGLDHILFLLALLLPAVGSWVRGRWQPVDALRPALWDVLRVVTAFTVAHSITLSLATLGLVSLPSRLVESAIAFSVVLAALNNVWPVFHGRRWTVAFVFGLVHGFGFASVLAELGLPQGALALALLGFNLGVEAGQLAIVVAFLVMAFPMRRSVFYRQVVLRGGSLLIAALAAAWFAERAFELKLLPF